MEVGMDELTVQQAAYIASNGGWLQSMWLRAAGQRPWVAPNGDAVVLARDASIVTSYDEKARWPKAYDGVHVSPSGGPRLAGESLRGMPIESVPDGAPLTPVWVNAALGGTPRLIHVPLPKKPWIEGHPHRGGEFDRHWLGVTSSGRVFELILLQWKEQWVPDWLAWAVPAGYPMSPHWEAMQAGIWQDGQLVDGAPVCAGQVSLASMMLTKDSLKNGHVLGLALNDYRGHDGKLTSDVPLCGDRMVLVDAPPNNLVGDARRVWDLAMTYGVRIYDRSGMAQLGGRILTQAGAHWVGSNISDCKIPLSSLRRVTSVG